MAAHLYWRVLITGAAGGYVGVYSLDFQDANGNSLCVGGNAYASSQYAYYAASRAFPGGAENWISNGEGNGAWIAYQFTAPVDVAKIAIAGFGPCNDAPSQPVNMQLQSSDDGQAWDGIYAFSRPDAGWVSAQAVTYNVPPPAPVDGRSSQIAYVVPGSNNTVPYSSQFAYVMPMADQAIPSIGAQSAQLAYVVVGMFGEDKTPTHGYSIRQLWGFPLLIQGGV